MLPSASLPMPATWRDLLDELGPAFSRRSTHRLFVALACGMILADRSTVVAMAAAAGIAGKWRRACWFLAGAVWDIDALGLAVARLIVKHLLNEGEAIVVAADGTFFKRWGRKVAQARWAYDGSAQGGKKIAFGNTWVIAAIVCRLPFCSSPVALPVLFRLWRGKGTASQVELAAEMVTLLAAAFPGRIVLVRDPGSARAYDLGLFTLDTDAGPAATAERYSWRWPIEASNAAGKQILGVGDACNRTEKAVERTVPFGFLIQALLILWYARCAYDPADIDRRRRLCPWYRTKTGPSVADMLGKLRREFLKARFSAIQPGQTHLDQIDGYAWTCDGTAA